MNKWFGAGFLVKDPTITQTTGGKSIVRFTLACNGWKKDNEGKPVAEFINCVAWNEKADFLASYCNKGDKIGVIGSLGSRSFEQEGVVKTVQEITIEQVELMAAKNIKNAKKGKNKIEEVDPTDIDEDLPF